MEVVKRTMISKLALASKIMIILVGAFFILMGFDVFDMMEYTFLERLGGFFISTLPGIVMILVAVLLWKKENILGFIVFGIALFWLIFLLIKGDFPEMIMGLLIVDIPLAIAGIILLVSSKKGF